MSVLASELEFRQNLKGARHLLSGSLQKIWYNEHGFKKNMEFLLIASSDHSNRVVLNFFKSEFIQNFTYRQTMYKFLKNML